MYVLWKQFIYVNCSFDKVTDFLNNINVYEYVQYILLQMPIACITFWKIYYSRPGEQYTCSYLFQCTVHVLVYEVPTEACAV